MTTTRRFGLLQGAIVLAAVTTALIHIVLYFQFPILSSPAAVVFLLNGIGYLGLTALLFLPLPSLGPWRNAIRWVLIVYTLITIISWVFVGARSTIAYIDKVVEVILVICLWLDWQRSRI